MAAKRIRDEKVIELVFPSDTTLAVAKDGTGNMEDNSQEKKGRKTRRTRTMGMM
jgi:hypothetical protein